jgi:DNA uptake protein ComE-like DNA-binding protein
MPFPIQKPRLALAILLCALPSILAAQVAPPAKPAPAQALPAPKPRKVARKDQVDMNNASKASLKKLPGITDDLADKIIAGRPYLSKTKLVTKGVLSNDLFQRIREGIFVGAPQAKK